MATFNTTIEGGPGAYPVRTRIVHCAAVAVIAGGPVQRNVWRGLACEVHADRSLAWPYREGLCAVFIGLTFAWCTDTFAILTLVIRRAGDGVVTHKAIDGFVVTALGGVTFVGSAHIVIGIAAYVGPGGFGLLDVADLTGIEDTSMTIGIALAGDGAHVDCRRVSTFAADITGVDGT